MSSRARQILNWARTQMGCTPLSAAYVFGSLRVGIALVLILQAFLIAEHFHQLWTPDGFIDKSVNEYFVSESLPTFPEWWLISRFVENSTTLIRVVFAIYVVSLVVMLFGWLGRAAVAAVWLSHFILFFHQGYLSAYGVDTFAHIFLFYLMIFPSGEAFSISSSGNPGGNPGSRYQPIFYQTGLWLMQFHLALAYMSSGILKAAGEQWQNGEVIWRALMLPQFSVFDFTWLASYPTVLKFIAWGTLFVEGGYLLFVCFRQTRPWVVVAVMLMHTGIAVAMGLVTFSLLMIVLNGGLFLVPQLVEARFAARRGAGGISILGNRAPKVHESYSQ